MRLGQILVYLPGAEVMPSWQGQASAVLVNLETVKLRALGYQHFFKEEVMTQQAQGAPLTVNVNVTVDGLNYIIAQLALPSQQANDLIMSLRTQALDQLKALQESTGLLAQETPAQVDAPAEGAPVTDAVSD